MERRSFFQTKANTTLFSRKMQNYSSFPQGLESIWFVPLLHWRSHTEIRNGPCSPLTMSPGHQRQKILREENLLCLAGSLPPFPVERTIKTTQWFLSLSTEKHQAALVQQYMLEPQQSSMQDSWTGLLCAQSWGHTVHPKEMLGTGKSIQQTWVFLLSVYVLLCRMSLTW